MCSTTNTYFTTLGVTSSDGKPAMAVVIFQGEELQAGWAMGIDVFAEVQASVDDTQFVRENSGKGKHFPFGPTCVVRGIEVPCMCVATPSGGITGKVLTNILRTLDQLGVTQRDASTGLKPHMQLDGHSSRFELEFLQYITANETEWSVCIGVPYGTSYWQLADSSEQNGSWKMVMS